MQLITLMPLFIFFTVGAAGGAYYANRRIAAGRKAAPNPDALYQWQAVPLSTWKVEPEAGAAILTHTLAILAFGLFALRAAFNPGILNYSIFAGDRTMVSLVWFVEYGAILLTGYQLGAGAAAFFQIVYRRQAVPTAVTAKGMFFGLYYMPWAWFSRYALESGGEILRLYSVFAPDLPSLTFKLPGSVPREELEGTLQGFIPGRLPASRAWYQAKAVLPPAMVVLCLAFVLVGWLASSLSRETALFLIAVLVTLLVSLGGRLLRLYAFGALAAGRPRGKSPSG